MALFAALLGEALLLAPPGSDGTAGRVVDWLTGSWSGYEPMVVAHFQSMGVWPVVLAAMCAPWLRGRPVPLWPFALGSMALGGFVLLPGLALPRRAGPPVWGIGSRWVGVGAGVVTLALAGWALAAGHAGAWQTAYGSDQLVHVMTWDFIALWAVSIGIAQARDGRGWWCVVPLLGACAWVASRMWWTLGRLFRGRRPLHRRRRSPT